MRVLILQQAVLAGQMLAPGVVVDVDDATAALLIEAGAAQALDQPAPESQPRKRAKTQE
ncbi:MAG: hypothetical protein RMK34_09060 [Tepidimonas sp.]|uniref:DUF7302 family protein n=1 Tax=Tepidimonas sp. TaxID=2002775 RepID=UPI00298F3A18|nr:hypothetical protein [Tepidimonas sp.]MCX7691784.1 hypothetical protein [Tepidimonas taiwanensis]MDW8337103.1 hypothetical protein [Tepidimonas sp.]